MIRSKSVRVAGIVVIALLFMGQFPGTVDWVMQIGNKPFVDSRSYVFRPRTPGGTLTASNPATVTFANGPPPGMAGTDTSHPIYISGGTGTPEAPNITGGTCTLGQATSCTITFTPSNNHSGAWTIQSATAGIKEAIVAAATGNTIRVPAGSYAITQLVIDKQVNLIGAGPQSTIFTPLLNAGTSLVTTSGSFTGMTLSGFSIDLTAQPTLNALDLNGFGYGSVSNLRITKGQDGLRANLGAGFSNYQHIDILDTSRYGVWVNLDSTGEVHFDGVKVLKSTASTMTAGFQIDKTNALDLGAVYIDNSEVIGNGAASAFITTGLNFNNINAAKSIGLWVQNSVFEQCSTPVYLKGAQWALFTGNDWFNSYGGSGAMTLDNSSNVLLAGDVFVGGGNAISFLNSPSNITIGSNDFTQMGTVLNLPASNGPTGITLLPNTLGSAAIVNVTSRLATALASSYTGPLAMWTGGASASQSSSIVDPATNTAKYLRVQNKRLDIVNNAFSGVSFRLEDNGQFGPGAPQAFSSLASCASGIEGEQVSVTDSTTATWGATITGGGTNHVLAYCDGTAWTVAGK